MLHAYTYNILPDKIASEKRGNLEGRYEPSPSQIRHTMPYAYSIVKTQKAGDVISAV